MSNERLHKAMTRYVELWGANAEDNIAQQVAYAAREIERGELPDQVVAMFRRANELRAWHKARSTAVPEADARPLPDDRQSQSGEREARIPEASTETSGIRTEMIALINVAQQALDSLIVERMELVRLQRSTDHVDTTISAARQQLGELHRAALGHHGRPSGEPSVEDLRQVDWAEPHQVCIEPRPDTAGPRFSSESGSKPALERHD
jgi:hypothetical protein